MTFYIRFLGFKDPRVNISIFEGAYEYVIFWDNREMRVISADIKCANGKYLNWVEFQQA